jgi:hypothetical protein
MAGKGDTLATITSRLNKEITKIKGNMLAGLWAAGLHLQGQSMRRVPVEHGNLRGSAYTRNASKIEIEKPALGPKTALTEKHVVEVGYGAAYAFFVHENIEQKWKGKKRKSGLGVYWGPAGEPKFLERTMNEESGKMLALIASYAEMK